MAENVISMDKKQTKEEKNLESFVNKNKKGIVICSSLAAVCIIAVCVAAGVIDSNVKKALSAVETIEYKYTKDSSDLSDEEIAARKSEALNSLADYTAKNNVAGVRANMLAADIYFSNEDWENAKASYIAAASKGKKAYTASLSYFNAGVCCEKLSDLAGASENYKAACDDKYFVLRSHALFSQARVLELLEKIDEAKTVYQTLVDSYSGDSWASLAQSRLIDLKINGKIE